MALGSDGLANPSAAENHNRVCDSAFSEQQFGFLIVESEANVARVGASKKVNIVISLPVTGAVENRLNRGGRPRVLGRRFRFLRGQRFLPQRGVRWWRNSLAVARPGVSGHCRLAFFARKGIGGPAQTRLERQVLIALVLRRIGSTCLAAVFYRGSELKAEGCRGLMRRCRFHQKPPRQPRARTALP